MNAQKKKEETIRGFSRGLEPEGILGATNSTGELYYLMKWLVLLSYCNSSCQLPICCLSCRKDSDESDLVSARDAKEICPKLVIEYLETKVRWPAAKSDNKMSVQNAQA